MARRHSVRRGLAGWGYCIGNVKAVEDPDERMRYEKVDPTHRMDLFDAGVIACKQHIIMQDAKNKLDSWF